MDKIAVRAFMIVVVFGFLALAPQTAYAQNAPQPTQILIGAPATPKADGSITVQAVLADAQGHPISKAVVYFTTQQKFLGSTSDVVLAQAVTNASGQAVAEFTASFAGPFALQAEFRGDQQYGPSNAIAQVSSAGMEQVYVEHVGVDIPGFNVPPVGASRASVQSSDGIAGFIQGLWPAMNGWPIAAVLLLVWSMYLFAVVFVFRAAASSSEDVDAHSITPRGLV
ncbi:MAG: Ig-like domain-containing protein [Anaerolineales bacterium]